MVTLVFSRPEIPQNTGTLLRTTTALGVPLHLIRPLGFLLSHTQLRRSHLDYGDVATLPIHDSWKDFQVFWQTQPAPKRLVALTPDGNHLLGKFAFCGHDWLMLGSENKGLSAEEKSFADITLRIPLRPHCDSLNVAIAGSICLWEALRQLR